MHTKPNVTGPYLFEDRRPTHLRLVKDNEPAEHSFAEVVKEHPFLAMGAAAISGVALLEVAKITLHKLVGGESGRQA